MIWVDGHPTFGFQTDYEIYMGSLPCTGHSYLSFLHTVHKYSVLLSVSWAKAQGTMITSLEIPDTDDLVASKDREHCSSSLLVQHKANNPCVALKRASPIAAHCFLSSQGRERCSICLLVLHEAFDPRAAPKNFMSH
eukprot:scaffold125510_cov18-Tisochrysis_lutea.AAC.1